MALANHTVYARKPNGNCVRHKYNGKPTVAFMSTGQTVFVVDDDAAVRDSLSWLIKSAGLIVQTYPTALAFLDAYKEGERGCLIVDVRMPGMSGLELQESLSKRRIRVPVIVLTGHGDVPMAVKAIKAGALEFIEKPFDDQMLLDRIQDALEEEKQTKQSEEKRKEILSRLSTLTKREREVFEWVILGSPNKVIAAHLDISCRTIEIHRKRVMEKMNARSLPELVRMGLTIEPK